jgi:serine/threonine protein kinase
LFIKELGKGAYGIVFKAQLRNSEKMRAIKQIKKKSIKFPETFKNEI